MYDERTIKYYFNKYHNKDGKIIISNVIKLDTSNIILCSYFSFGKSSTISITFKNEEIQKYILLERKEKIIKIRNRC